MRVIAIAVVIAAFVFVMLSWIASRSLFYPVRYPAGNWAAKETLGAVDVWLRTADGIRIHGWWIAAPGARLTTLHLHGNGGNLTHRLAAAEGILKAGSSVLLLDYRGYGRSEGAPSESGVYADADAAYRWLLQKNTGIVIHGESLGTSVAVHLAARHPSKALVLEAPFTSAGAVAHTVLPFLGPLVVRSFNTLAKMPYVHVPVFIIHGDRDEVIDFQMGRRLFASAAEPKRFWEVKGAGHNDIHYVAGAEYSRRLREFYDSL